MPFNASIYVSLLCAIVMIAGGIWLLAKGAIKLSEAGKSEGGLSVELFNKIKLNTGYPALAFFIIGLFFIAVAIWFSKPADILSLNIDGKLNIEGDPTVMTVSVVPNPDAGATFHLDSDGDLARTFHPEVQWTVTINAPSGYDPPGPFQKTYPLAKGQPLKINLQSLLPKDVKFTKKPVGRPPSEGEIIPAPDIKNAPPVQEAKGFKPPS